MPRQDTETEKRIHELVPSSRDLYPASDTRVRVQLESSAGLIWANSTQISLEGMTVELLEPSVAVNEVRFYCELPNVRASVEGRAAVTPVSSTSWVLRFTHLTPRSALAIRALTRAERVRRSPSSTATFGAITDTQLTQFREAVANGSAPSVPTSLRRPGITLSRLRAVTPSALDPDPSRRNSA